MKPKFWENGLQFQCQGSGRCCVSHGGYGNVYLTKEDRQRLSQHLGVSQGTFTRTHCEQKHEIWKLKDRADKACVFLQDKKCSVYEARPTQCRTWPFWPEVLEPKRWNKEVASFCPGVGKGRVWTREEIEVQLKEQIASESEYGS